MFQKTVARNYTTGFPGDVVRDGPMRAKAARILSPTLGADSISTNRVGRAFGYAGEYKDAGNLTYTAQNLEAEVGGTTFLGILFHSKHYALAGSAQGSLSDSLDLPMGAEGEFTDMCTGLVVPIVNPGATTLSLKYGDQVAYVPKGISGANNPLSLPLGALVGFAAGAAVPTGMLAVPGAIVINPVDMAASAAGAVVSAYTIIQMTR